MCLRNRKRNFCRFIRVLLSSINCYSPKQLVIRASDSVFPIKWYIRILILYITFWMCLATIFQIF
ncbi:hypothetical protein FQR65_LT18493 [Abscondita terminalis]|nr:hypothetical protein FQR65_LT18493 [Abscondita terminalis]